QRRLPPLGRPPREGCFPPLRLAGLAPGRGPAARADAAANEARSARASGPGAESVPESAAVAAPAVRAGVRVAVRPARAGAPPAARRASTRCVCILIRGSRSLSVTSTGVAKQIEE